MQRAGRNTVLLGRAFTPRASFAPRLITGIHKTQVPVASSLVIGCRSDRFVSSSAKRIGTRFYSTAQPEPEVKAINCAQAKKDLKTFDVVVDVREPDEVTAGKIAGAKHVALGRVVRDINTDELQSLKGKKLLVYCRSGGRSGMACKVLQKAGFDATNLEGGWNAWSKLP